MTTLVNRRGGMNEQESMNSSEGSNHFGGTSGTGDTNGAGGLPKSSGSTSSSGAGSAARKYDAPAKTAQSTATGKRPVPTGKVFGYDILEHLGEGAGSTVYVVTKAGQSQLFALKHVQRTDERSVRFIEQLENEFTVGKHVRHPNLRTPVDYHVQRTLTRRVTEAALVLELVDGVPLDVELPRRTSSILEVFIKTAEALEAMHRAGYVHCDLKPGNIMVTTDRLAGERSIKVIDLGQACPTGTAKLRIQGTPDFISPEQVKCKPVTALTDVFNLGATLYWALAGTKLPTLFNIKKGENSFLVDVAIPTPQQLNPFVPEHLSNFVMECVRTNPLKRPQSMSDIARRLEIIRMSVKKQEQVKKAAS